MSGLILVVDDDPGIQEFLQLALEAEGYEVVIAEDGKDALEKLADVTPDLILLDLMMPRVDGYTFARAIQQQEQRPAIPFVVFTADAQAKEKAALLAADAYLVKPFDLIDLLETVARFLS